MGYYLTFEHLFITHLVKEVISLVSISKCYKVYGVHNELLVARSVRPTTEGSDLDLTPTWSTQVFCTQLKSPCNTANMKH